MNPPNVNVIFHGLGLFVEQDGYIDLLIPNMGTEHVYRAGSFLAEENLAPRPLNTPYCLAGVTAGNAKFDTGKNFVIPNQNFDQSAGPDQVYARIVLPYPAEIVSLRPTRDVLHPEIDPAGLFTIQHPCGVQVLRYFASDITQVSLSPHPAKLTPNVDGKFVNLHIICEEDEYIQYQARSGFERLLALLPGVKTPIIFGDFTTVLVPGGNDVGRGYSATELLDPIERNQQLLAPIGALLRDNPAGPLPVPFIAVGDPPFDCWPIMADNSGTYGSNI
jgi:hypothetical protein